MKFLKNCKKNLFKSLLLLFASIFIATCNSNIALASTNPSMNFSDSYKNAIKPYEYELDYSTLEIELFKSENGNFEAVIPFSDGRAYVATSEFSLLQDFSISNMYTVSYCISANTLVNGIRANIAVTNTSFLFPESYMDKYYSKNFTSTTLYYGDCGNVIIPPDVKSVKIKVSSPQIYFLAEGWKSGASFTGTYKVN